MQSPEVTNELCRLQNGIGIVLAGGFGGFLYLKNKDTATMEEKFTCVLFSGTFATAP